MYTNLAISNYITTIIYIILLIIIIAIIYCSHNYIKWHNNNEAFNAIKQMKQTQAKVDAMDNRDLEECSSNNAGFNEVCRRHTMCCKNNAVGQEGCLCTHPTLEKCHKDYQDCKAGRGASRGVAMNKLGAEFVGAKAARGAMCQAILDNCCNTSTEVYNSNRNNANKLMTEIKGARHKPIVAKGTNGPLCSQLYSAEDCAASCAADPRCKVAYRDNIVGICELYKDAIVKEKNVNEMRSSDSFQLWIKGQGLDSVKVLKPDVFEGFSKTKDIDNSMVSRCLKSDGSDNSNSDCIHPVINDCLNIKTKCENEYGQLLGDKQAKQMCAKNHKACCGTLDNIDLASRFSLNGPKWAQVQNNVKVGKWQCDISDSVKSIDECKKRCLEDPRCSILDSNMAIFKGLDGGMDLAKMPPSRCIMYGNDTKMLEGEKAASKKKIGEVGTGLAMRVIYEPNNIWHRKSLESVV